MRKLAAALCVLPLLTLAPFLGGGLLLDDYRHAERLEEVPARELLTAPDAFQMFRPAMQASLIVEHRLGGGVRPAAMRATNLFLHVLAVLAAFALGLELVGDPRPACLAALGVLLAPKAAPIAVLWISARAEILMSIFAIIALIGWIRWDRHGRPLALAGAAAGYVLALLSKETAVLLPLLFLLAPFSPSAPAARRAAAVAGMVLLGAAWYLIRDRAGAVGPADEGLYFMMNAPGQWLRSQQNYLGRALPPAVAILVAGAAIAWVRRRAGLPGLLTRPTSRQMLFAAAWFVVFMLPVLGLAGRSEVRLYVAGFGWSLAAAVVVARTIFANRRHAAAVLALLLAGFGGYQAARAAAMHGDLVFSARFARALAGNPDLRAFPGGTVEVGPGDGPTERVMRDAIGGYISAALRLALDRDDIHGIVPYVEQPQRLAALRLQCVYRDGVVELAPLRTEYRRR